MVSEVHQGPPEPIQSKRPELYLNAITEKRMTKYCNECGANKAEVDGLLVAAEEIVSLLKAGKEVAPTPHAARALIWYAMGQAAEQGKQYTHGSFRIQDQDGRLFKFLIACLKTSDCPAYPRISSHMHERITAEGQWGLDFAPGQLPARAETILLSPLNDGTLYIKPEATGVPPFWKSGFRTLNNFIKFVQHSIHYVKTRFAPSKDKTYSTRKEHVPARTHKEYKAALIALKNSKNQDPVKIALLEGKLYGKSVMLDQLKKIVNSPDIPEDDKVKDLIDRLQKEIDEAKKVGYSGHIKGQEVLLPPWTPNQAAPAA